MTSSDTHLELRKNWRRNWFSGLYEFANLEHQRKLWIKAFYKNKCSDFTECMCSYFDDQMLSDGYQYVLKENLVSKKEVNAVNKFHILADQYDSEEKTDAEILSDANWKKVVDEATIAWTELKKILVDKDEITYMNKLEEKYGAIEKST